MRSKRVISLINIVYYPQVLNITEWLKIVFNFKCFLIQTFNCILLLYVFPNYVDIKFIISSFSPQFPCQDRLCDIVVINFCPYLSGVIKWTFFLLPAALIQVLTWEHTLSLCQVELLTSRSLSKRKEITAVLCTLAWRLYVSTLFMAELPEPVTLPRWNYLSG